MLFTEPFWLSVLSPICFALVLLFASLFVRYGRRVPFDTSPWLSTAGVALAFVTGGWVYVTTLCASLLFMRWIALSIEQAIDQPRHSQSENRPVRTRLCAAVAVQVAVVVAMSRRHIVHGPLQATTATLVPFGVSYFAFHGISYVVDVYRHRIGAERSPWRLATYLFLMPQIVAGPVSYATTAPQVGRREPSLSDYSYGIRRLLIGMWKVFIVAALVGPLADGAFALAGHGLSPFQAWVGLASFTIQMYYRFSGYSDMGIGVARTLGVRLPENFYWPYIAETVREFWERWHVGLSTWFDDYVDGSLRERPAAGLGASREALAALLCGIWYGFGWSFVVWGAYHAVLLTVERRGVENVVKRLPGPLRHLYVITLVIVGWVLLRSQTVSDALLFLKALVGLTPVPSHASSTIDLEVWLLLTAGAFGCAPLVSAIRRWAVAIDALIASILIMLVGAFIFAWRCVRIVAATVLRWWRWSMT